MLPNGNTNEDQREKQQIAHLEHLLQHKAFKLMAQDRVAIRERITHHIRQVKQLIEAMERMDTQVAMLETRERESHAHAEAVMEQTQRAERWISVFGVSTFVVLVAIILSSF